jgi:glycosyltransferase involved in cell wall biosynthesis
VKILQLISSAGFYGAESCLIALSEQLREQGHDVTIATFATSSPALHEVATQLAFPTKVFQGSQRFDLSLRKSLRQTVIEDRFDLVHAHGYKADFFAYSSLRGLVPLISTCHGWPTPGFKMQAYARADRFLLRSFDKVVAVSEDSARLLRSAGVHPSNISLIRNGVKTARFDHPDSSHEGRLRIGVIGRIVREKGSEFAFDAFLRVASEFPQAELVFAGEGPLRESLQRRASQLGIAEKVVFRGFCDDMPRFYSQLDVVVMPSFYEGMPMVLLESMAAGKAIVSTNVGEVPAVLRDGFTGFLVQPGNCEQLAASLRQVLADEELRVRVGREAKAFISSTYDIVPVCNRYLDVYRSACQGLLTPSAMLSGEVQ